MKTKFILLLSGFLIFPNASFCQNKKKTVPKKQNIEKKIVQANSFLGDLMMMDIDEATLKINDLMEKDYVFTKIVDNKDFIYDENLKKTDEIYNYFKILTIEDVGDVVLTADENKKITEITFYINDNPTHSISEKLIGIFGINKWNILEKKGNQSILSSSGFFTTCEWGEGYYRINAFKPVPVPVPVDFNKNQNDLSVKSSFAEVLSYYNQSLINSGNELLFVKKKSVINDKTYSFINYNQDVLYKNGTTLNINLSDLNKVTATISNRNPILFSTLKSKLMNQDWKYLYPMQTAEKIEFYRNKNTFSKIYTESKVIYFYTLPEYHDDLITTADFPTPYDLNEIYTGFSNEEDQLNYLKDHFAYETVNDSFQKFKVEKNGYKMSFFFLDKEDFEKNWGVKFLIDTDSPNLNAWYKKQIDGLPLESQDFTTKGVLKNRTQFYDKGIFLANQASQNAIDAAQKIAQQKSDAITKQREIEKEQSRAKTNQAINEAVPELMKSLQQILK